jgi:hypothetical protein
VTQEGVRSTYLFYYRTFSAIGLQRQQKEKKETGTMVYVGIHINIWNIDEDMFPKLRTSE